MYNKSTIIIIVIVKPPTSPSSKTEQHYTHRTITQAECITKLPHYLKNIIEHELLHYCTGGEGRRNFCRERASIWRKLR